MPNCFKPSATFIAIITSMISLLLVVESSSQTYSFGQKIPSSGGLSHAEISYFSQGTANPGRKNLRINAPRTGFVIERDKENFLERVTSNGMIWESKATTEEWAKSDPNAFTITTKSVDGEIIREVTVASVDIQGQKTIVMRSVYLGKTSLKDNGKSVKHGDIKRDEYSLPSAGLSVTLSGYEQDGKFISLMRNKCLRHRDDGKHRLIRLTKDTRESGDEEWKTSSDVLNEEKLIDHEMRLIKTVQWPDGEAITEEWAYYSQGDVGGPDGFKMKSTMIKSNRKPDGTMVQYFYGDNGSITETKRPNQPLERAKTSFKQIDKELSERTTIEEINDREVFRKVVRHEPSKMTTIITRPNQPSETLMEEFYPVGIKFGGKPRRTIQPDGTITTWERIALPDNGNRIITEHGRGDGEKVVEGTRMIVRTSVRGEVIESHTELIK